MSDQKMHGGQSPEAAVEAHPVSVGKLLSAWVALLILLVLTVAAAFLEFGSLAAVVALGIALAKTVVIGAIFMHLDQTGGISRASAIAGLISVALLVVLVLGDVAWRGE